MDKISMVTPAYKCNDCIEELYNRLIATFKKMKISNYEIIFVNDSSPLNDWEIIENLCKKDNKVKGINLSRNFGQHRAITAGLKYATGDYIIVMDCDLQDRPEEIEKFYNEIKKGYDIVYGRRYNRRDGLLKKLNSKMFYLFMSYLIGRKIDGTVANFIMINKKVLKELNKIGEQNRSFGLFLMWLGFKDSYIDVEHSERYKGETSYNLRKAVKLAFEIAITHSNRPLKIFVELGFGISFISFLYGAFLIFKYFVYNVPLRGWTSTMVSLYFIGGLIIANLGIIGIYVGKIFDETKKRPIYVVSDELNIGEVDK